MQQARLLSKARAGAAPKTGRAITQAMQGLGMQGGQFESGAASVYAADAKAAWKKSAFWWRGMRAARPTGE